MWIIREINPPPKCGKLPPRPPQNEKSLRKIRRTLKKNQKDLRKSNFFFSDLGKKNQSNFCRNFYPFLQIIPISDRVNLYISHLRGIRGLP